ncbi:MAG: cupredoxin domain-containing protein [Candidatus Vogelbacteria bacterium]|nr:cupredoxin domain-containing protein [Candidatus Vogelbacteria bacterium]
MDNIIVIIVGVILVAFIYWFFLMKKSRSVAVDSGQVEIMVSGGYTPEIITVPVGRKTVLNFTRTDESSCLEEVVLGDFNIRRTLPLNQKVAIEITPKTPGEHVYSCGMGMFHGKIIVK